MTDRIHIKKWNLELVKQLFEQPFNDLMFKAQQTHRNHFNPNEIQASSLVNIQQGGCPEDCKWCAQSVHHNNKIQIYPLMKTHEVVEQAKAAKSKGASRLCLGAAWRKPTQRQLAKVGEMVQAIKNLGLETCVTLGQLSVEQAKTLKEHGLDYYNHNLETSPEHFEKMTTTRSYEGRLKTLENVKQANLKVCSGGIVGMGESLDDQLVLLVNLANLEPQPKSVPINMLIPIPDTPLSEQMEAVDEIAYIRLIATARIMMPNSYIRLSAGREKLSESTQALAFLAGANSFFLGDKLLTVKNRSSQKDQVLLSKLGMDFETTQNSTPIPTDVRLKEAALHD